MKKVLKAYKKTVSIIDETAIQIYESLGSEKKGFLMESNDKENGRYTFMGVEPQKLIQSKGNSLVITDINGEVEVREGNPFEKLKEYFDEFEVTKEAEELEFMGGLVGSFGYDFIRYTEKLTDNNEDEIGIETIQLMLADKFIAIDHMGETMTAVVLEADNEQGKQKAQKELEKLLTQARKNKEESPMVEHHNGKILKKSDTLKEYEQKVEKIKEYIRNGHISYILLYKKWSHFPDRIITKMDSTN